MEFEPFPKIPRLNRGMTITEKIDGTNACVLIEEAVAVSADYITLTQGEDGVPYGLQAQSRNRLITPEQDNAGFARWVEANAGTLVDDLGPGRHFGEWWGRGVQRGYDLDHKRFSLFNTSRWQAAGEFVHDGAVILGTLFDTPNLHVTPVLYEGQFDTVTIDQTLFELAQNGSAASPGFMNPEGVVVFQHASNSMFKVTIKGDEAPKSTQ